MKKIALTVSQFRAIRHLIEVCKTPPAERTGINDLNWVACRVARAFESYPADLEGQELHTLPAYKPKDYQEGGE